MGISGLLPFVKKAQRKTNLRNFSGSVVAVDGFCWLHKGAYGCAQKLGMGEPTTAYVTYFMKYVNILLANGLRPILVFDGRSLPSKEETNRKRRERREENRIKAKKALRDGNKREAWECFQKSVEITPTMVREVIKELRAHKLDYIISPYESDAQMAFLANTKIVDMVITEDSDLVLFGCPKIFFKLKADGDGVLYDSSRLHLSLGQTPERFQFDKFRQMCIFSGCDYLESLSGIGLSRAKKIFTLTPHDDITLILKGGPSIVKLDLAVTDEYLSEFQRAENTFLYQLVFDPVKRQLCPLTPYPKDVDPKELTYCGNYESPKLSLDMALGNVDIQTLKTVDNFDIDDPKRGYCSTKSIWSSNLKSGIHPPNRVFAFGKNEVKPKPNGIQKKTVVVSSDAILKRRVTRANAEIKNAAGTADDTENYGRLLLNSFCRSPSPKRHCSSNSYSLQNDAEKGSSDLENKETEGLPLEKPPLYAPSTTTDSDDSSMMTLKGSTPGKPIRPVFGRKGGILSNGSSSSSNPLFPKQGAAVVVIEKLEPVRATRSCRSRYFTAGKKEFLGNKNHSLFAASASKGTRTCL